MWILTIITFFVGLFFGIAIASLCGASKISDLESEKLRYKHTCQNQQDKINQLRQQNMENPQ